MVLQCSACSGQNGAMLGPTVCAPVLELFAETRQRGPLRQIPSSVSVAFARAIRETCQPKDIRCPARAAALVSHSRRLAARRNLAWELLPWPAPGEGIAAAVWRESSSSALVLWQRREGELVSSIPHRVVFRRVYVSPLAVWHRHSSLLESWPPETWPLDA